MFFFCLILKLWYGIIDIGFPSRHILTPISSWLQSRISVQNSVFKYKTLELCIIMKKQSYFEARMGYLQLMNNIKGKMVYVNYTFLLLHHYKIILVTLIINIFFLLLSGHDHLIIAWQPSWWWIQASMNGYTKQTCDIDTIIYIKMKSTSVWLQM